MPRDVARRVAEELNRRGLAAPARLLADAHRPLGPLLEDLVIAVGPLARAIGGTHLGSLTRWLEDPGSLDRLVVALDMEEEPRAQPG